MAFETKNIGIDNALRKIKHYCSYQERNHDEVRQKLYGFGLYKSEVEQLLTQLIEEDYLNEERFAIAYAGGKFRMKSWGRNKIKFELTAKKISAYSIKKALASIDEKDYRDTLRKLYEAKLKTLRSEKNIFIRKKKIQNYLMGKGFEFGLISDFDE